MMEGKPRSVAKEEKEVAAGGGAMEEQQLQRLRFSDGFSRHIEGAMNGKLNRKQQKIAN